MSRRVSDGVEVTAALEPADDLPPPIALGSSLAALRFHGIPEPLLTTLAAGVLAPTLATVSTFASLPREDGGPPLLLVALPGASKTLTVARLATHLVMAG